MEDKIFECFIKDIPMLTNKSRGVLIMIGSGGESGDNKIQGLKSHKC